MKDITQVFFKQPWHAIWFMISEKSITRSKFLHRGVHMHQKSQQGIPKIVCQSFQFLHVGIVVLIDVNMHMLTEDSNFKTFLKEIDANASADITYLLESIKHGIEHDIDSAYGVCIQFAYSRFDKYHAI